MINLNDTVITETDVMVKIIGGTYNGQIGIVEEINENLHYQNVIINGETHPITNDWIVIL